MSHRVQGLLKWLSISAIIIVIDLWTKHLVQQSFQYGEHRVVTSFFDLVRYHNEGAAFSFLAAAGGWQKYFFTAIALIASVAIIYLLKKNSGDKSSAQKLFCFGLAIILGGALGNLYDRMTLGYVIDFLFFHYQTFYWPAFNVADSAICVGVGILLLDSFKKLQT